MKLFLVKIGGSSITDITKPNVARRDEIRRIGAELKKAREHCSIILGHGSGSFAHIPAAKYKVQLGIINNQSIKGAAITRHTAAMLNMIVVEELNKIGIHAIAFPPSSSAITRGKRIIKWDLQPMRQALKTGFMPITYGDVTQDTEQGVAIVSTEETLRYIASVMKPDKIIVGSDVDGVFTANPKLDKKAKLIKFVNSKNIRSALNAASESTKIDVTGGMHSKLQYLYDISKATGATCQIVNINVPGRLYKALLGEEVTSTTIKA